MDFESSLEMGTSLVNGGNRSHWVSRTSLSPSQLHQGPLREVNPPEQVPSECITAVPPLYGRGTAGGGGIRINIARSGNISSLLHLCVFFLRSNVNVLQIFVVLIKYRDVNIHLNLSMTAA